MSQDDQDSVKGLIEAMGLARGEYKLAKDPVGVALAIKDGLKATMARMMYTGRMSLNVINFKTLAEEVNA